MIKNIEMSQRPSSAPAILFHTQEEVAEDHEIIIESEDVEYELAEEEEIRCEYEEEEEQEDDQEASLKRPRKSPGRLAKDSAAKKEKLSRETAQQRRQRLEQKREINRRYFDNESTERREMRLARKANRDRRNRLDMMLQAFHPDLLDQAGIEVLQLDSGLVEMRVPWAVPPDETEEQRERRYDYQESVIRELQKLETPAKREFRLEQSKAIQKPQWPRRESEAQRQRRLERCRDTTRKRRMEETPEQRERRLEMQRVRTRRNRELKAEARDAAEFGRRRKVKVEEIKQEVVAEEVIMETVEYQEEVVEHVEEEVPVEYEEEVRIEYIEVQEN